MSGQKRSSAFSALSPTATLTDGHHSHHSRWHSKAAKNLKKLFGIRKRDADGKEISSSPNKESSEESTTSSSTSQESQIITATHLSSSSNSSSSTHVDGELIRWVKAGYITENYGAPLRAIGQGTGGTVSLYEAGGKKYAIKQFQFQTRKSRTYGSSASTADDGISPNQWKHLLDEAHFSLSLRHPCIIQTYEFVREPDNKVYSVMEYCELDLFSVIQDAPPVPDHPERALDDQRSEYLFYQILCAMHYLHTTARIAHRDIKLDNICVEDGDRIRMIDFGCSLEWSADDEPEATDVCGSNPYIAPEVFNVKQLAKRKYDPRPVDIWALAIVYLSMISGHFPWEIANSSDPNYQLYVQHRHKVIDHWVKPSHPANKLINDMLSIDSTKRPTIQQAFEYQWVKDLHEKYGNFGSSLTEEVVMDVEADQTTMPRTKISNASTLVSNASAESSTSTPATSRLNSAADTENGYYQPRSTSKHESPLEASSNGPQNSIAMSNYCL
ncbi:serine/threonine protein kinase [Mycoemilia scoparia]|uniref:Serine/threonine protein kinase n=1 Tax=Mycoemilia scoparia TaxID=417184 RepID=A0A9W7ZZS3_9FUNG|nr:serine/threonine protein kinase [Mycoemilia scoparia]